MTTPDKDKNLEWMDTVRVEDPPVAETSDLPVVSRNLYRIVAEVGKGGIGKYLQRKTNVCIDELQAAERITRSSFTM